MDDAESVEEAYFDEMARFCIATGYHPDVYWSMDQRHTQAFFKAFEEQNGNEKKE